MPMKWTPDNNEMLLVKILETSSTNFDCEAIAAAWPTDRQDRPTARAIRERLFKIRSNVKAKEQAGHFSIGQDNRPARGTPKTRGVATAKPRARAKRAKTGDANDASAVRVKKEGGSAPVTPTSALGKRRRIIVDDHSSDEGEGGGGDGDDGDDDDEEDGGRSADVVEEGSDAGVETPVAQKTAGKGYSTVWLPADDWEEVKTKPEGKGLLGVWEREFAEQGRVAKPPAWFDGARGEEEEEVMVVVKDED